MNLKFWQKPDKDIEFKDTSRSVYQIHPIQLARDVRANMQDHQLQSLKQFKFANCPGMIDLKNYGYIIPAWDDIHIMANKAGIVAHVGGKGRAKSGNFAQPRKMDSSVVDGLFTPADDVAQQPLHIGAPWSIFTHNKNVSVLVLPAVYHSTFLDDLFVYPGIVDYNKFTTINFIAAPRRACKLTIKAGDPLLHVIPFEAKHISAGYGPATDPELDMAKSIYSTAKQFYRKYIKYNKPTTISLKQ